MTYEIKIPQFEGPFDLLLFFIERDELDIYDIPIAKITDDFLDYISRMHVLNIELASEFILVAATLMRIKAKMLLPRKQTDEEGNEVDPRTELVEKLIEYKKFKEIIEDFKLLEDDRLKQDGRGNVHQELLTISKNFAAEQELYDVNLFKLLKAFERVVAKFDYKSKQVAHRVVQYPYTIKQQKHYLLDLLKKKKETPFEKIFSTCKDRIQAIFIFLSLLELLHEQMVQINIGMGVNNFWLSIK
ncbi:MAG: segregation/condensation protein A [Bacteroidetes bacterium]|nr:segregation/condensation protein A [Bacteroidota bacterium]